MNFPDCLTSPVAGNTFAGVSISQTWNDLTLWEAFLSAHPPASVLELGSWRGGMATFLGLQGLARGFPVVTVDHNLGQVERPDLLERLGIRVEAIDLFSAEGLEAVKAIIAELPRPLLLFCDNGNKPGEYHALVPGLMTGDMVAVHDWGTEFHESNLVPSLPYLMREACEAASSMTRFFQIEPINV